MSHDHGVLRAYNWSIQELGLVSSKMSEADDPDRPITTDWVLELLNSRLKLGRERGILKLEKLLKSWEKPPTTEEEKNEVVNGKRRLQSEILEVLEAEEEEVESRPSSVVAEDLTELVRTLSRSNSVTDTNYTLWEKKHGYLLACYPLISFSREDDKEFMVKVRDISIKFMSHPELRIQLAAGGVLGFMSKYAGPSVFEASKEVILDLIEENLKNVVLIPEEHELKSVEQGFDVNLPAAVIREKVVRESLAWKNLEPSLRCLLFTIENLESDFIQFMEPRLVDLVFQCFSHPVRYVREAGFQICTALIVAAPDDVNAFAHRLSNHLSAGLSDNWNQVRMAAAIATRKFFVTYASIKEEFYPVLLPKLCLNRYYTAEGIRIFVQDSWKLIVGTEGIFLVSKYMSDIVSCYLESTNSSNLAEIEAACACISELATKIDSPVVLPHVPRLLEALISSARNDSWSVRDAACLSCGNFVMHYPAESKFYLDEIYKILFRNLGDPILLLRQGAATALGNIVSAYGTEAMDVILPKFKAGLMQVERMKEDSSASSETGNETEAHDIFPDENACIQHEPQCEYAVPGKVLVTSESLFKTLNTSSPFLTPCLSCRKSKIPQPWHLTDGWMYLMGSLAEISECANDLNSLLPLMIKSTEVRSYPEHYNLHETFCKVLPLVAKAIGKKSFKDALQTAFDPIFYTVESSNPATSTIGKDCLRQLAQFIGPNILRSRVELYDPRLVHLLPD